MPDFVCIGVPYYLGESKPDRREVEALRRSGVAAELGAEWIDIEPDFSAVDDPVVTVNRALAAAINAHSGKLPIVFANDCTSCLGMVKGLESRAPTVLWYDSHGDFNTPETSPSGFLGGMPLAALVGRGNQHLMRGLALEPIPEADVIITDVRNLDPEEGDMLRSSGVTIHETLDSLRNSGVPDRPLYIHFDTDVVDCKEMPAMSYPEPNGPGLEDCIQSLKFVFAQGNTAAILFSLWNQTLEGSDVAMAATRRLILSLKSIG